MTLALYHWTVDRYHTALDAGVFDNQAVELLRGNLVVMAPEREPHACYSSTGAEYLRQCLGDRAAVRETKPITLPNDSEPIPDIAIVRSPLRRYLDHHPYPMDIFWLIEYANTTLVKDLGEKKDTYADAGILEYWVVDLQNRRLRVFRDLQTGIYQAERSLTQDLVSPLAFPDITLEAQRLFS
ncbi:MAG: Uma2 family endonuclease [Cyanobacteria bacterium J06638_20]